MRLTTWMSIACPRTGYECDAQNVAKAFTFIATARPRRVEVELRRGQKNARDASRRRSGSVRKRRHRLRRRRSSRRLPICRRRLEKPISPPPSLVASSPIFLRLLRAGSSEIFRRPRKAGARSTSTPSTTRVWPTFRRQRLNRSPPASIRLPTSTCLRLSKRPVAPTFRRRCPELRGPRSTCRLQWAPRGREASSRWLTRSICRWHFPTPTYRRRSRRPPCQHRFRSTPSYPCPAGKKICPWSGRTSWTSISKVRSGFTGEGRSS